MSSTPSLRASCAAPASCIAILNVSRGHQSLALIEVYVKLLCSHINMGNALDGPPQMGVSVNSTAYSAKLMAMAFDPKLIAPMLFGASSQTPSLECL